MGYKIREVRESVGMSQTELSEKSGVSRGTISALENGTERVTTTKTLLCMDDLNYQYQVDRDKVADDQWLQQWQYQQERDKIADEQWLKEYEESVRQFNEQLAFQQAQAARSSSSGGSGRSNSGGGMTDYQKTESMLANPPVWLTKILAVSLKAVEAAGDKAFEVKNE